MRDLTKAVVNPSPTVPTQMLPCTVTQVSPLLVTLNSGAVLSGIGVAGLSYPHGSSAIALWTQPNNPLILPIGA